jgi:hypothetical protein
VKDIQLILESSDSIQSVNDGYLLDSERVGNFEWWYFDCIDIETSCILKIVVHLGTDPLRSRFFPTLALSIKTPDGKKAIESVYDLNDFWADKNHCDVRLGTDCRIYSDGDHPESYFIDIQTPEFRASLKFEQTVPVWIPPVHKAMAHKGHRKSELFWNVLQPGAIVNGSFEYNHKRYTVKSAIGYHDHNYWQLNSKKPLFMDEVVRHWKWGKCVAGPYTVIFMEIRMGGIEVKSIMVSEHDKILYSTDKNMTVTVKRETLFKPLKSKYPSEISVRVTDDNFPLELVLACEEVIESKDLLNGVNPFISWLIKRFVARPAYYGINSTAILEMPTRKLAGFGNYEYILFRN